MRSRSARATSAKSVPTATSTLLLSLAYPKYPSPTPDSAVRHPQPSYSRSCRRQSRTPRTRVTYDGCSPVLFDSRSDPHARTCIKWESIRKRSPNTTWLPTLQYSDHPGKTPPCSARSFPPSCPTGPLRSSSSVTTSVRWSTRKPSSLSGETGQKAISGRPKPSLGSEDWTKPRRRYRWVSNLNPTTP